jgi:ribose transport system substrate-binding protein
VGLLVLAGGSSLARALTVGVVAKSVDDANFVDAWRGCDREAKKSGDSCVLLGGRGKADPRFQSQAIEAALKSSRFDALAISVTASEIVAKALQSSKIPVVSFDSPFAAAEQRLSRAYIGADNVGMGRDLAREAMTLRPRGGTLCLMSAAHDPNLAQRIQGVRQQLSGNEQHPEGQRLNGENGWTELRRCPWNAGDNLERSRDELAITLRHLKPDVFLSVGHWPVVDSAAYRETVEPYREDLVSKRRIIIVCTGALRDELKSLLSDGLVHGYVVVNFDEIGRLTYLRTRELMDGKRVEAITYSANITLIGK